MDKIAAIKKIRAFNRFYTNVISVLDQSVLNSGFSLAEARILYEINLLAPCTAREIMEAINIDEGYLSRIITKFVSSEILIRSQTLNDKRRYELHLTQFGKAKINELELIANHSTESLIQELSPNELTRLLANMESINKLLTPKIK